MELVKQTAENLNPQQVTNHSMNSSQNAGNLAFFREYKLMVMLGGLHIEMALWSNM